MQLVYHALVESDAARPRVAIPVDRLLLAKRRWRGEAIRGRHTLRHGRRVGDESVQQPAQPEPEQIKLTRTQIQPPTLTQEQYENSSILYLKPGILDKDHVDQVEAHLRAMPKDGNTKVLLDLRDDAGDRPPADGDGSR